MMLNLDTAIRLVNQHIGSDDVISHLTRETEWGWVFFYGANESLATPLMVDKDREVVINVGKGHIDEYITTYTTDRDEIIRQINAKENI